MTENERNQITAICAEVLDKEAEEWNITFFDFMEQNEEWADYAMTKAMTYQDAAELIRLLSPDYRKKKEDEREKIKKWTKSIREGKPGDFPQIKDN